MSGGLGMVRYGMVFTGDGFDGMGCELAGVRRMDGRIRRICEDLFAGNYIAKDHIP